LEFRVEARMLVPRHSPTILASPDGKTIAAIISGGTP
jgi:hypothetical protein